MMEFKVGDKVRKVEELAYFSLKFEGDKLIETIVKIEKSTGRRKDKYCEPVKLFLSNGKWVTPKMVVKVR